MPIASFSSFTDGLDRGYRSRDHFITNINLEDDSCGSLMRRASGSSPATLTSRLEDSASC
jgi:hypothetical protein